MAAARACAPLPFYCYAFTARSGYPIPVEVIRRIGASVDNLAGLKVSESPFDRVEPYLDLGLPVLIGNEPLIPAGLARGAIGSVSGMAAAFPEVVRAALDDPTEGAGARLTAVREAMEASGQFIAAAKEVLRLRGVPVRGDVRAPLRPPHDCGGGAAGNRHRRLPRPAPGLTPGFDRPQAAVGSGAPGSDERRPMLSENPTATRPSAPAERKASV